MSKSTSDASSDKTAKPKKKIDIHKAAKITSDVLTVAGIGYMTYSTLSTMKANKTLREQHDAYMKQQSEHLERTIEETSRLMEGLLKSSVGQTKVKDIYEKTWADYAWDEVNKI